MQISKLQLASIFQLREETIKEMSGDTSKLHTRFDMHDMLLVLNMIFTLHSKLNTKN